MQVVITGGAGFLGKRLARRLLEQGNLTGCDGQEQPIDKLLLCDIAEPTEVPDDPRIETHVGDFTQTAAITQVLNPATGVVFHLAAVVSAAAEADFDLGMQVNLHGSMKMLEALRQLGTCPRLLFASSLAVYGGDIPEIIQDDTHLTPQNSYGIQKAAVELLINDYSRKGFIDGRVLRLPTVVVRPGKPNKAASSFASAIVREPLQGDNTVCPVKPQTELWLLSPRRVIESFIHATELPSTAWGAFRTVAVPGMTVSVSEMMAALTQVAGQTVTDRVRFEPDPVIETIIYSWPTRFNPQRGLAMGFKPDDTMVEIIQAFIEDDLGGNVVV